MHVTGVIHQEAQMGGDPHGRTEKIFAKLIAEASSNDTKLLLEGLRWLCILTEENGFGMQDHAEQLGKSLTEVSDKLDNLSA